MRVAGRQVVWDECPIELKPYTKESQTFLSIGKEYEVHSIAIFKGSPILLIVDDLGYPTWKTSWLFDIIESSIPGDWICNLLHEEPVMLLGPEFIAKDENSYGAMVELEVDQVDRFWKRIETINDNP